MKSNNKKIVSNALMFILVVIVCFVSYIIAKLVFSSEDYNIISNENNKLKTIISSFLFEVMFKIMFALGGSYILANGMFIKMSVY